MHNRSKAPYWAAALLVFGISPLEGAPSEIDGPPKDAVHLEIASEADSGPEEAQLLLVPITEDKSLGEPQVTTVQLSGGRAEVSLPSAPDVRAWRASVTAPGFWSPATLVEAEPGLEVELVLWPAGQVEGEVHLPDTEDQPEALGVRLSRIPGSEGSSPQPAGPVELTCRVEKQMLDACLIPAGRWNLRFAAAPFAPEFLWDLSVEPGKALDVGTLNLKRGGSIFGQLRTEQGAVNPLRARVWLRPTADPKSRKPRAEAELAQLTIMGEIGPDGEFQIVGVPPGSYQLQASHPGFVTASRAPVSVEEGEWTEIPDPLALELPLRLSVAVEPTTEPAGGPWHLQLYPTEGRGGGSTVATSETDAAGIWESPLLPAGDYDLWVLDAEENVLARQEIALDHDSRFARVEMPLVYVEGEVILGDEPVEGTIRFEGRSRGERVETQSDESGEFFVVLPREGEWQVFVQGDSPPVRTRGLEVEIESVADLNLAEVTIEIPNTTLVGRVTDEFGRPPGEPAQIQLLRLDDEALPVGRESDPQGSFKMRGIVPGVYSVTAEAAGTSSRPVRIELNSGREFSVTLALEPERHLRGQVVSESGPVPGATVWGHYLSGTGQGVQATIERRRSSATGEFELSVPSAAIGIRLVVMAPGYPLQVLRVASSDHVEIVLEKLAGTLRLEQVEDAIRIQSDSGVGLLLIDGEPVDLPRIRAWVRLQDAAAPEEEGALVVPSMPPGHYALCRVAIQEAWLVMDGAALPSDRACDEGYLTPGGKLTLSSS